MTSNEHLLLNCERDDCTAVKRDDHDDCWKFESAVMVDWESMSIPTILAFGKRCAHMSASTPEPVPISKMEVAFWLEETRAPKIMLSVPIG